MEPIIKKLLLNALTDYLDYLDDLGCNDLFKDDPLLKGINQKEQAKILTQIKKYLPELVKEIKPQKLTEVFNTSLVELLIKKIK